MSVRMKPIPVPRKPKHNNAESRSQQAVIKWFAYAHKGLGVSNQKLLAAIPNGGKRGKTESAIMKGEGVRSGWPDLILAVPRGGYHGLFIEMKAGRTNQASPNQREMLLELNLQGYYATVCRSFDEATKTIREYLLGEL